MGRGRSLTPVGSYATLWRTGGFWGTSSPERPPSMRHLTLFALGLAASAANAQGLDRDTLLTDAPAVAPKGTVRVTGGAMGTTHSAAAGNTQSQANIPGNIQRPPMQHFSHDVAASFQPAAPAP